jgi:hypothetical protein
MEAPLVLGILMSDRMFLFWAGISGFLELTSIHANFIKMSDILKRRIKLVLWMLLIGIK